MSSPRLVRLANVALRGMTLVSKFALVFFLARFLEPRDLGLYGLMAATIGYSIYLLGFDFYTFTTREILKRQQREWGGIIKDQGTLTLILYLIFLPFSFFLFSFGLIPWTVVWWFLMLLVLEHLNQEVMRFLVAISEQLLASVALFLRAGAWAVAVVVAMAFNPTLRNLETVFLAWAIGSFTALLLAGVRIYQLKLGGWCKHVDWAWIGQGIRIALPLLAATLAVRGVYTLDRYLLERLVGLEVLGAYVLFISFANAMVSFLEAAVHVFSYPTLITAFQQKRPVQYCYELQKLLRQTLVLTSVFTIVALLAIEPLLRWLGKPLYLEYQGMFPGIVSATFLYALSSVPHYALYAQGWDRPIIHSHIACLIVFVAATWLVSLHWLSMAVPLGLNAAFLLMLVWKIYAFIRLTPQPYQFLQS